MGRCGQRDQPAAVSRKYRSSSPARLAELERSRAPPAAATRPTRSTVAAACRRAVRAGLGGDAGPLAARRARATGSAPRTVVPWPASRTFRSSSATTAPVADHHEAVDRRLHLAEQVARQQRGAAACGEVPQQQAHPADPLGVHPVGRFVEDRARPGRRAGRCRCRGAGACRASSRRRASRAGRAEADLFEHHRGRLARARRAGGRRGAASRCPVRPGCCAEASSITPIRRPGFGCAAYGAAVDRRPARRRRGEAGDHPQRRRLARAVRPEEPGDGARAAREGDVVDGDVVAVALDEVVDVDHAPTVTAPRRAGHRAAVDTERRRRSVVAAVTARPSSGAATGCATPSVGPMKPGLTAAWQRYRPAGVRSSSSSLLAARRRRSPRRWSAATDGVAAWLPVAVAAIVAAVALWWRRQYPVAVTLIGIAVVRRVGDAGRRVARARSRSPCGDAIGSSSASPLAVAVIAS